MVARSILTASSILFLAAHMPPASSAESRASGTCVREQTLDYRTARSVAATQSTTFVNVANAVVSFTVGGTAASCVFVRYAAETDAPAGPGGIDVRLLLDGTTVALPGTVSWVRDHEFDGFSAQSFEFIVPTVSPGSHVARVQWRSIDGQSIQFGVRTLTATHR
jgi:hypothetical protein